MAITAAEKLIKIKERRSQSVKSKLDLLKSRDGSEAPPIESLRDVDLFNRQMLFGFSGDANIDWSNLAIDGLMRSYYYVIQMLIGKRRDNIIINSNEKTTVNSGLEYAANSLIGGTAYNSGFFVGNSSSSQTIKTEANKGTFDENSSSLNSNISTSSIDSNNIPELISQVLLIIGVKSPLWNAYNVGINAFSYSDLIAADMVFDTILGRRFTDIVPETHYDAYTTPDPQGEQGDTIYHPARNTYGNGTYDTTNTNAPSGFDYNIENNFYDDSFHTQLDVILTLCNEAITYLNYTKITNISYFTNTNAIPGYSDTPQFSQQDGWILEIQNIIDIINNYYTTINPYYTPGLGVTNSSGKTIVNNALELLATNLTTVSAVPDTISNEIEGLQGNVNDPNTMRGFRFLWVKSVIDVADGSMVALKGVDIALDSMNKSITTAEEGYGLFGITRQPVTWTGSNAWIEGLPTPNIAGIETYSTIDADSNSETFGEMISVGYIVAWEGIGHSTGYDLLKSSDWDGNTGTWETIKPVGNTYSIEDIDLNRGTVLTYYIDEEIDVDAGEKPYYKVIAYDSGGSGDYARIPAVSKESDPKYYDDFLNVASTTPFVGPSGPPPSAPGEAPDYLFKWTTAISGLESDDNPTNTVFTSEAVFDSIGSNLEVFVDGSIRHDFSILDSQKIQFTSQIQDYSSVIMIVYFGGGAAEGYWKQPVQAVEDLPNVGNTTGDIRLVIDRDALYVWDPDYSTWQEVKSATSSNVTHTQLSDMPDDSGSNEDHDERYYTKSDMNDVVDDIQLQLNSLQSLVPEEAAKLEGELNISGTTYGKGYLSGSSSNLNTLSEHQYFDKLINTDDFYITNPNPERQFSDGDKGWIRAFINGVEVDQFDLESSFNEGERNGTQSYPPVFAAYGKLEILSVEAHNNYPAFQRANFRLKISPGDLQTGENKILLMHELDSETRETDELVIFYDPVSDDLYIDNVYVRENTLISAKYLSGVRYYTIGDSFKFSFYAWDMFKNTYTMSNQFTVDGTALGCTEYSDDWRSNYILNTLTGEIEDSFSYEKVSVLNIENVVNTESELFITGRDPFNTIGGFSSGVSPKILVNTYAIASTNNLEVFVDEKYRLRYTDSGNFSTIPSNYINDWNSVGQLQYNELQVFGGQLIYPQTNYYENYLPEQSINYFGKTGDRYYVRAFIDPGSPKNNGKFIIDNYNINDSNVKITLKLPQLTGWLDITKPYNEADFTGVDGDGCLLSNNEYEYNWTAGGFSTADSGYMIILRVEMINSFATPINNINIIW